MKKPMSDKVRLHSYNPIWSAAYETEADALKKIFGNSLIQIEHIGSTAIPGIKAKPIIDILISVNRIGVAEEMIPEMEALSYEHRGEFGIPGRRYFRKFTNGERSHHVHIYQSGHKAITRYLDFRDYLRIHPDRAQAYSQLKEELAVNFRDDRAMYSESKTDFILETNRLAAEWRKGK